MLRVSSQSTGCLEFLTNKIHSVPCKNHSSRKNYYVIDFRSPGPSAEGERGKFILTMADSFLSRVNAKTTAIVVLVIVILVFGAVTMGYVIGGKSEVDNIQKQFNTALKALQCRPQKQSLLCTDFNPCTMDYIEFPCPDHDREREREKERERDRDRERERDRDGDRDRDRPPHHEKPRCHDFLCKPPVAMANGSCCNQNDFCYTDDPNKRCVFGTCMSPDPTKCKGFCNDASDCLVPVPINPEIGLTVQDCIQNSCVTVVGPLISGNDPFAIVESDTLLDLNISHCLTASCVAFYVEGPPYLCFYYWTCAPFLVDLIRKRDMEAPSDKLPLLNFTLPGLSNRQYLIVNQQLNALAQKLPPLTATTTTKRQ